MTDIEQLTKVVRILAREAWTSADMDPEERAMMRAFIDYERPADSDEVRRLRIEVAAANVRAEEARTALRGTLAAEVAKAEERVARKALDLLAAEWTEADVARVCAEAHAKGGDHG